ncbi:MAG: T9SS type A sorting domain-containing protein, partial [Bacteroidota bacterium]
GRSNRQVVSAAGEVDFTGAFLAMDFASVTPPGAEDEFVVYQLDEGAYNAITGTNVTSSYWIIRKVGSQSFEIDEMTFTIPSNNEISAEDEALPSNLELYKRGDVETGPWTLVASAVSASNSSKQIVFGGAGNELNMTSLSQFVIVSSTSSLPITLLSFEGKRISSQEIAFTWTTAREVNNKGFEVQISEDNLRFHPIAFIDGAGNSSRINEYNYIYQNKKAAYYRLRQIDYNGTNSFSQVRFIPAEGSSLSLEIYPNPSQEEVQLSYNQAGSGEILSLDILGMEGKQIQSLKGTLQEIERKLNAYLRLQPTSMYYLRIRSRAGVAHRRLLHYQF